MYVADVIDFKDSDRDNDSYLSDSSQDSDEPEDDSLTIQNVWQFCNTNLNF